MKSAVVPLRSLTGRVTRIQTQLAHRLCRILFRTINLCHNPSSYLSSHHSHNISRSSSNNPVSLLLCTIQHFRPNTSRWPGFRNPTDLRLLVSLAPLAYCLLLTSSPSTRLWFLLPHTIPWAQYPNLGLRSNIIILFRQQTLRHTRATFTLALTGKGKSRPQTSRTRTENPMFLAVRMAVIMVVVTF